MKKGSAPSSGSKPRPRKTTPSRSSAPRRANTQSRPAAARAARPSGTSQQSRVNLSSEARNGNANYTSGGANTAASAIAGWGSTGSSGNNSAAASVSPIRTSSPAPAAGNDGSRPPVEDFQYNGQAPGDYRGAVDSADPKAGTKANQQITQEYTDMAEAYRDYLGGDVASFPSMAQNGSALAGRQIQNLENGLAGLNGDPQAMTDALRGMANRDNMLQGALMGKGLLEQAAGDENPAQAAMNPAGTAGKVAAETVNDGLRTAQAMRDGLVAGNTDIHHSAAPAAHAFLKGEADGGKGMEALREAGYFPGSEKDPQGLYTKAYGMLGDVRRLGLEAAKETDPTKKAELTRQRDELMKRSNMHLFSQEQMTLEKPNIYGNPDMKQAIGSIGGTMALDGPNGRYDLLPNGGDWTDYKTRMGFQEVDKPGPDSVTMTGADGKPVHYQADPSAKGTVSHYSNTNTTGQNARNIVDNPPDPSLPLPVTTRTGAAVDGIGHGLANGNAGEVAGSVATLPSRLTSDAATMGGGALNRNGNSTFERGEEYYSRYAQDRPGMSDDIDRAVGFATMVGGGVRQNVGRTIEAGGRTLGKVAEKVDQGIETGVNATVSAAKKANRVAYQARMKLQRKLASMWPF